MAEAGVSLMKPKGRDAAHRTRNLDTHLTHGCIQHFRHFCRQRCGSAAPGGPGTHAFQPISKAACRQREGDQA